MKLPNSIVLHILDFVEDREYLDICSVLKPSRLTEYTVLRETHIFSRGEISAYISEIRSGICMLRKSTMLSKVKIRKQREIAISENYGRRIGTLNKSPEFTEEDLTKFIRTRGFSEYSTKHVSECKLPLALKLYEYQVRGNLKVAQIEKVRRYTWI